MKPSITFIMSFVATVLGFSPYAVAKHVNTSKNSEYGKHCEFDRPDKKFITHSFKSAPVGAPTTAHSAGYVGNYPKP